MAGRVPTQNFDPIAQLQPAAAPVDGYVYPGTTQNNTLTELAGSLQSLEPSLSQYAQQKQQKVDATDLAAGQQAYLKSKASLKDAVDRGLIKAGMSPAFKRGYQQSELRVLGMSYDQQLRDAYTKSGLQNNDDPNAITNFTSDFTSKFLQDKTAGFDPLDVSAVLTPAMSGAMENIAAYHSSQRAQLIEQGHFANTEVIVATTIDNALAQGKDVDAGQLGSVLTARLNEALSNGGDAKAYNQMLVDQVVAKAQEQGDPSLLKVLDHVSTGPGGLLGKTTYAREHSLAAEENITSHQMQIEAYNDRKNTKAKEDAADNILRKVISTVTANPAADVRVLMNQLGVYNPEKASSALALQQSMLSATTRVVEDPSQLATIMSQISGASDKDEQMRIITSAAQHHMIDGNRVNDLFRYGDDQLRLKPTTEKPFYKDIEQATDRQLNMKDPNDPYGGAMPNVPIYQEQARRRLKTLTQAWITKNSDASGKFDDNALELYLDDESDKLVKKYRERMTFERDNPDQAAQPAPADPFAATQSTQ